MDTEIINRVAKSDLITLDLEEYYPKGKRILLDIKAWLFEEIMLREKDFRNQIKEHDWNQYTDCFVAITCSADAIVPTWAYMLVATKLAPFSKHFCFGNLEQLEQDLFSKALTKLPIEQFQNAKVVIKGCSKYPVPVYAYTEITRKLQPLATSIMYGEPCSTVPIYKRPK